MLLLIAKLLNNIYNNKHFMPRILNKNNAYFFSIFIISFFAFSCSSNENSKNTQETISIKQPIELQKQDSEKKNNLPKKQASDEKVNDVKNTNEDTKSKPIAPETKKQNENKVNELQKNTVESSSDKEIVNIKNSSGETNSFNVSKKVADLLHEMLKETVLSDLWQLQKKYLRIENTSTEEKNALQLMYSISEKRIEERTAKILKEYEERQAADKEEKKVKEEADKKLGQQIAINDQRLSTITKLFEARKLKLVNIDTAKSLTDEYLKNINTEFITQGTKENKDWNKILKLRSDLYPYLFQMALTDNPFYLYELALYYIPWPIKTTWIKRTDEEKYKTAYSMLKVSSDQKHPKAQYRLSELYAKGNYVKKDIIKSEELLKLSYEQGYSKAISTMALRYIFGTTTAGGGITQDTKKGIKLLEELSNAEKYPDTAANKKYTWMKTFDDLETKTGANYLLGQLYFGAYDQILGENYKDLSKTLYYWNKAKEGNGPYRTLAINKIKENENELKNAKTTSSPTVEPKKDYDEAVKLIDNHKVTTAITLLESAANAGNQDAQLKLSQLYEEGWIPDNCYDSNGQLVLDQNSCVIGYSDSKNIDYVKMIFWLKKYAEESKDMNSQFKIAWAYHTGKKHKEKAESSSLFQDLIPEKSIESDAENAFKWFKISAENDHQTAQEYLSKYYFYGIFVPQSYTNAFDWAKLSYDNGGYTRRDLIHYYYYGVGVEKNVQKAGELCIAGENPSREYYKKELYKESEGQKCLDENNEPRYSKPKPACPVDPRNIQGIRCTYPN